MNNHPFTRSALYFTSDNINGSFAFSHDTSSCTLTLNLFF